MQVPIVKYVYVLILMKVVEDRTVVFFFGVGLMFISQEYFNNLAIENHQLISPSSMSSMKPRSLSSACVEP